jgi:hypothetical protein
MGISLSSSWIGTQGAPPEAAKRTRRMPSASRWVSACERIWREAVQRTVPEGTLDMLTSLFMVRTLIREGAKELAGFGSAAVNSDGFKALVRVADRYAGAATIFAVAVLICATGWSASTVLRAVRDGGVKVVELDVAHRDVTAPQQPAGAAAPGGAPRA